jgi:serine-type D-Ala-D-Ala carboxypeptidase/endopeptidase (penicillin-binding protein 4)
MYNAILEIFGIYCTECDNLLLLNSQVKPLMKKLLLIAILLITAICVASAEQQDTLANKVNAVLTNFGDTVSIGIQVKDLQTGKVLYNKNAEHYLMPASNEKLFTASAALASLDQNFTYKTQLFVDITKVTNGVLNDNVYLQFSGDPTLTFAQLDNLIHALSQAGIHQITGKIIVDDSSFDQMSMSPGSTWDDKDFCWGSPVNAITIEHNCVKATLVPAKATNQRANLSLPEYPQSVQFINNVMTRAPDTNDCIAKTKRSSGSSYTINGCISATTPPKDIEMAIDNPRANLIFLLTYLLDRNQIINTHAFEFEKITLPPALLASVNSLPVSNLVTTMLKESDNTIANSLFKTMGSLFANEPGSFQNGSDAVRNILNKSIPLDIPTTTLVDGSGTSRYDFVTPQQIVTLLQKMYSSSYGAVFVNALPIGGVDGTLKDRMKDPLIQGKVYAKTGSETAVSTLSGYLQTNSKHTLVFSIMINGFVDSPKKYQELEDKICATLIENT